MFWRKKEKPKPMCFLIKEDLVALSATDGYVGLDIKDAISDTGKATVGSLKITPENPDVQKVWVYPFPETPDVTAEEIIASLARYGFHATFITEESEYVNPPRGPYSLTVYIPWFTWSKHHKEDE
jgi:hypothetical protein